MNDNKKKLYDVISGTGQYTKSYDDFLKQYSTPESVDKLYKVLSGTGQFTKSREEFGSKYFPDLGKSPASPSGNGGSDSSVPQQPSQPSGNGFSPFRGTEQTSTAGKARMTATNPTIKTADETTEVQAEKASKYLATQTNEESLARQARTVDLSGTPQSPTKESLLKGMDEAVALKKQLDYEQGKEYRFLVPNSEVNYNLAELQTKKAEIDKLNGGKVPTFGVDATEYQNLNDKLETAYKSIEGDYLTYLSKKDPSRYSQYTSRLTEIEQKGNPSLGDQEFLQKLRAESLEARMNADKSYISDVKKVVDLDAYGKGMTLLQQEGKRIEEESKKYLNEDGTAKSPLAAKQLAALNTRIAQLGQRQQQLVEDTGVTPEILNGLGNAYNSLAQSQMVFNDNATLSRFPELWAARTIAESEKQAREDIANAPLYGGTPAETAINLGKKGAVLLMGFMDSVGSGTVSMLEAPKVIGEALGNPYGFGTGYDWTDALYDLSTDLNTKASGRTGSLESDSTVMNLLDVFANGAGSITQFALGGELAYGGKALTAASKIAKNAGVVSTAFLMSEGQNYREALDAGLSSRDAAQYATMVSAVQAMTETIVPDFKYFEPAARASLMAALKSGSKEEVKSALGQLAKHIATQVPKTGIKEAGEEVVTEVAGDLTKEAINAYTDIEIYKDTFNPKTYFDAALGGFVAGGGMTAIQRGVKLSPTERGIARAVGENADEIGADLAQIAEPTAVPQTVVVGTLKQIVDGLNNIPAYQALGNQEKDYVVNATLRKKQLEEAMRESGVKDDVTKAEIEDIENEINGIYQGKKIGQEYVVEEGEVPEKITIGSTLQWDNLNDSQNKQGISSPIGEGQAPIEVQSNEGTSGEATSPSGILQTQEEVSGENPTQAVQTEDNVANIPQISDEEATTHDTNFDTVVKQVKEVEPTLTEDEADHAAALVQEGASVEEAVSHVKSQLEDGSTVELPPLFEGGMPRQMIYEGGEWKQKVGGQTTEVAKSVQQEAQETFVGENVQVEQAEVKDQATQAIDLMTEAARAHKTQKNKAQAMKEAVKDMGEVGEKAIFVQENFKEIVEAVKASKDLKGQPILKVVC